MNRKPDALVILALIFGLGLLVSALTHGENEHRAANAPAAVYSSEADVSQ